MIEGFRVSPAGFTCRMGDNERQVLAQLVDDVRDLLESPDEPGAWNLGDEVHPPEDPAVARLLPDGSRDDAEVAAEFRRLTQEDLRGTKIANLVVLRDLLLQATDEVLIVSAQAATAASALNDVRLVLAERLDIRTEEDAENLHRDLRWPARQRMPREQRALGEVYEIVTWWQESLVVAMVETLDAAFADKCNPGVVERRSSTPGGRTGASDQAESDS